MAQQFIDPHQSIPTLDIPDAITIPNPGPTLQSAISQAKARNQDLQLGNLQINQQKLAQSQALANLNLMQQIHARLAAGGVQSLPPGSAPGMVAQGQKLPGGLINNTGAAIDPNAAPNPDPAPTPTLAAAGGQAQPGTNLTGAGSDSWQPNPAIAAGMSLAGAVDPSAAASSTQATTPQATTPQATTPQAATPTQAAPAVDDPGMIGGLPLESWLGMYGPKAADILKPIIEATKGVADLKEVQLKNQEALESAERDAAAGSAQMVASGGYSRAALNAELNNLRAHGHGSSAVRVAGLIGNDDLRIRPVMDGLIRQSKLAAENEKNIGQAASDQAKANETNLLAPSKAATENTKYASQIIGSSANAAQYAANLETARRIAPEFVKTLPAAYSADAVAQARRVGLSSQEQTTTDQRSQELAETARHNTQTTAIERGRLAVEQGNLGLRNQEFQANYGKNATGPIEGGDEAIAQKLATGDYDPQQLRGLKGKVAITNRAIELNPGWTPFAYQTKHSFLNPDSTQAKNMGTISRIVGHLGRYQTNSQKMGWDPVYGSGGAFTGTQKALGEDAHAIAGELEKLVSGSVGSETQMQAWAKGLTSSYPTVRKQAVDELSKLIGSQYEGMNQTYKNGTGLDLPQNLISPEGREWMKANGIHAGASSAEAPAYQQTATGPNNHKIGSNDGGKTWFDVQTGKAI